MQWRIVGKDGRIVEVMEVVGVEGSRVLFERYLPLHDTVLKTISCSEKLDIKRGMVFHFWDMLLNRYYLLYV